MVLWQRSASVSEKLPLACEHRSKYQFRSWSANANRVWPNHSAVFEELPGRPTLPRLYGLRAQCFYKTANYNAAIDDCTKFIELRPQSNAALEARAEALIKLGDYAGAEKDLEKAVEQKTMRPRTFKQLGLCQVKLGKYNEAEITLSKAVTLFPKYAVAYELRAEAMQNLGQQLASGNDRRKAMRLGLVDSP